MAIPPSLMGILDQEHRLVVIFFLNRLDKKKLEIVDLALKKNALMEGVTL